MNAQALTAKYFELRALSDAAFKARDGALSTGAALAADLIAQKFKRFENLESTDKAVERMRQLRS